VAAGLNQAGDLARADGVVGREVSDSEVHPLEAIQRRALAARP
jgi:hypothetical protein